MTQSTQPPPSAHVGELENAYFPAAKVGEIEEITIGDVLQKAANDSGDIIALKEMTDQGKIGRCWSYQELFDDARKLANALLGRHAAGDRIAIWAPNIPEWVLLEYAAAMAGITIVTVNPAFQARELKYVLGHSGVSALYLVEDFRGNPMGDIARSVRGDLPDIKHMIDMTDEAVLFSGCDVEHGLSNLGPETPAQIQYTSGTTGFPKGAILSHRGLYNNARFTASRVDVHKGDCWMNFMPMFHTSGCGVVTLGCLAMRATMILTVQFEPNAVLQIIEQEGVSAFSAVPTMLVALNQATGEETRDVSSIRSISFGGSIVAPELVRQTKAAFGANPQILYGQTETSPVLTMVRGDDSLENLCNTVGQPIPHTEISIRNSKTNEVMPLDTVGEICARGYMRMVEYLNMPEATAETIDGDGWLHTGDLGTMDAHGYVKVTGRVKEMIIRGGENLYPAEIENAMIEHPDLLEVAIVGVPDSKWGEAVACFMRPKERAHLEPEDLVAFCRERLSPQKTPAKWIAVDQWPLTGSGKIQKFKLRDGLESGKYQLL